MDKIEDKEEYVKVSDGYFAKSLAFKLPHKFLILYMYLPFCVDRDNLFHISSLYKKADELEISRESLNDFIEFMVDNEIILPVNESDFVDPEFNHLYDGAYFVNPEEIWASSEDIGSVPYKKKCLDWDMYKATYKSFNFMIRPRKPKKWK